MMEVHPKIKITVSLIRLIWDIDDITAYVSRHATRTRSRTLTNGVSAEVSSWNQITHFCQNVKIVIRCT